jgi:hypothetical protein
VFHLPSMPPNRLSPRGWLLLGFCILVLLSQSWQAFSYAGRLGHMDWRVSLLGIFCLVLAVGVAGLGYLYLPRSGRQKK